MTTTDSRTTFEAWADHNGYELERGETLGMYRSPKTLHAWVGFQAAIEAALSAQSPSVAAGDVVPVSRKVYDFLMGQGELRGSWFGAPVMHRPKYWWREDLRTLINKAGSDE